MSDRAAFLAAICAEPDADLPRLIFADWLDEQGECERAEFIRVQCELDRPCKEWGSRFEERFEHLAPQRYRELRRREHQLIQSAMEWVPVRGSPTENVGVCNCRADDRTTHSQLYGTYYFGRGFAEQVACSWEWWQAHAEAIIAATPLKRVQLTSYPFQQEAVVPGRTRDELELEILGREHPGIEFELPAFGRRIWQHPGIIQSVLTDLGPPSFSEVAHFVRADEVCRHLLGDTLRFVSGPGRKWKHATINSETTRMELVSVGNPPKIVDLLRSRRRDALAALVPFIANSFREHAGADADPREWRMIALEGEWLTETAIERPQRDRWLLHWDLTYDFEPIRNGAPVAMIVPPGLE